jgi:Spy/CpxP family protein refolding chaperone
VSVTGGRSGAPWIAAGLLLLAFVAGALGGVAADRLLAARSARVEPALSDPGENGPLGRGGAGAIFPAGVQLARQLNLSPEQRDRIEEILVAERSKADSVLREVRPLLQARYDSSTQAVRAILTPEQRERFDRLRDNRRDLLLRRRPPRGRRPLER